MIRNMKLIFSIRYLFFFIPVIVISACNASNDAIKKEEVKKEGAKLDSVNVVLVKMDSIKKDLILPGELTPYQNAQIRAKVPGYIRKVNVDIGSKVVKGQLLALVNAPEIQSKVQEINARVKSAQARYQSSKDYYERISTASKSDGVIAPSELQRTHDQMLSDEAEYNAATYAAASNRKIGNYLAILAPYSGVITKRNIDQGSYVGTPNEPPLFELQDNSLLRLKVAVPESYTGAMLKGNSADLTSRAFPDKTYHALLVRKSGSIDNTTRSEIWEFEVPNQSRELKPGSYADVKLHLLRAKPSLIVPSTAIVTTLERKFVIRISEKHAKWIDVRAGFSMGDKQEIFGDLQPGDTIVAKGTEEMKTGKEVIPRFNK